MRLYSYYRSSASYRVRVALALKRIDYEYIPVDISNQMRAQATDAFEAINPMGQVPVLEWAGEGGEIRRLAQSSAIVEYLEEIRPEPPLLPQSAWARAKIREAVQIVNAGIQPLQNLHTLNVLRAAAGPTLEARFRDESIARGLVALERAACEHEGPFFFGVSPSIADVFIIPQLYNARRFGVAVGEGRLKEIEQEAANHAAFKAAHPDQQPDAPQAEARSP